MEYKKSHIPNDIVQNWYDKYFNTKYESLEHFGFGDIPLNDFDIYITAFGSPFLIEYQILTLKKFFVPGFNLIIVDTNQDLNPIESEIIKKMCWNQDVGYIKMHNNIYQEKLHFDPSMKLGTTINWLYYNLIKEREPAYFGFLDHDCFLFKKYDIRYYLEERGMYGTVCVNESKNSWNLHVICNFYEYNYVKNLPLDFRPSWKYGLDTGGCNFEILYQHHKASDYKLLHIGERYFKHDVVTGDRPQHYDIIDNKWFHVICSTHDRLVGEGSNKLAYTKGFLDFALK